MEDKIIPDDFDGRFFFTNWSDEDFVALWNSVEYTFPAMKRTAMYIENESPQQVQEIRKKFAKELAVREFAKTPKYKELLKKNKNAQSLMSTVTYSTPEIENLIQKCLEPLPEGKMKATKKAKKEYKLPDSVQVLSEGDSLTAGKVKVKE